MKWISVKERLPKPELPVIVWGLNSYDKVRRMRACWVPKHYMESDGDSFQGDDDYCEEKDMSYWPEGWYEWNEYEETHWLIDIEIKDWMPLPDPPSEKQDSFLEYIKEQREDFVKIVGQYPIRDHLELRTEIDSLLIAYDQMAERLKN